MGLKVFDLAEVSSSMETQLPCTPNLYVPPKVNSRQPDFEVISRDPVDTGSHIIEMDQTQRLERKLSDLRS